MSEEGRGMKAKIKQIGEVTIKDIKRICEDPNHECIDCPIKAVCQVLDIQPFEWDDEFLKKEMGCEE